jgi:biofilm PGA synthesis N-glycosyltransferase PgaC
MNQFQSTAEIAFWLCLGTVCYAYIGYPLLLMIWSRCRRCRCDPRGEKPQSISVVMAVYNEEAIVEARVRELLEAAASCGGAFEVIVVSDGSTDRTAERAREATEGGVRVLELPANAGKAVALTHGCQAARHEILLFADVRQTWERDAVRQLIDNFRDPSIGAVGGDLVVQSRGGVIGGVCLYWRLEKWLRRQESRIHSTVGVTGAICAVRRELFRPIPRGTILDDVYWPLQVVLQGYRVVHESKARAHDRLPEHGRDEFRRKVRTLSGNFQLLSRLPQTLLPWRNPVWIQFVSHKLLRLVIPWALLAMLVCLVILPGSLYHCLLAAQAGFYAVGLFGLSGAPGSRLRVPSVFASFLVLNAAAWLGFWVWATGKTARSWRKVFYEIAPCDQRAGVESEAILR